MSTWGPYVVGALRDAEVERRDDRGLMPLPLARDIVASARAFRRDGADRLWAALVSLSDADEACAALTRLTWEHPPRGRDNTALAERYGAGLLPWLRGRLDRGVLLNVPWCVGPCLLAIGEVGALELLWQVERYRDRMTMTAWTVVDDGSAAGDAGEEARAAETLRAG